VNIKAFSLIELMVVIAIVGILSALAVPAYKDYAMKAKIVEAVNHLDSYKSAVLIFDAKKGRVPNTNGDVINSPVPLTYAIAGTPTTINTANIQSILLAGFGFSQSYTGLQVKLSPSLGLPTANFGDTIFLVWKTQNGVVSFKCGPINTTLGVNAKNLPPGCNEGVDGW
jgi:type IV pilus assembly protein PilA